MRTTTEMTKLLRPIRSLPIASLLATAGFSSWLMSGCENEAAQHRAELQAVISNASQDLRLLDQAHGALPGEDGSPSTSQLSAIVSELAKVGADAEPGQQAAAALLTSAARREIGEINTSTIEQLDLQMRRDRQVARGLVDAVLRLNTIASSFEALSTEPERQALAAQKQEAEQQLQTLSQQIAELDEPIHELTGQNEADSSQVESLRTQAGQLLRQWSEQGSADGFDEYEQAVNLQRQADGLTVQIARRQADLDFELKPEQHLVQQQINELQSLIESSESSRRDLDNYVIETSAQGQATRQAIDMLTGRLTSTLNGINSAFETKVTPAYEEAATQFEQAAAAAEKAARQARGDEAASARLAQFRAQQSLGRVHWTVARTMQDQAALLDRVVEAPHAFGDVGALRTQRDAASTMAKDSAEKALAAFSSALELGGQIGGSSAADLEKTRADLTSLVASLSGQPAPQGESVEGSLNDIAATDVSSSDSASDAGSAPTGSESAEALLAAVNDIHTAEDAINFLLENLQFEFDSVRQRGMINQGRALARNLLNLNAALKQQFNTSLADMINQAAASSGTAGSPSMPFQMPDLNSLDEEMGEARLEDVTETGATLVVASKDGQEERVPLANIDGRWFIRITTDDLSEMSKGFEDGMSASSEEMTPEQMEMMMAMFQPVLQQANQLLARMIKRLEGGEFASVEEFRAAVEAEVQKLMPQMAPQMPGTPQMPETPSEPGDAGETPPGE
jgi:predicted  nucleic acid-binding Zn-ribbon protein